MNLINDLTARLLAAGPRPCKRFSSYEIAEAATAEAALDFARRFTIPGRPVRSARYVVLHVPSVGGWIGALDATELLGRCDVIGGPLDSHPGYFKF